MNCLKYTVDAATAPNNRDFSKPNEDCIVTRSKDGIFMLLDGITRVHGEYSNGAESAANVVNRIFVTEFCKHLESSADSMTPADAIRSALVKANSCIRDYRVEKTIDEWSFYPGTVGIMGMIRDDVFHYACVGDCLGVLIRGSSRIYFGEQQTLRCPVVLEAGKLERYRRFCNKPDSPYAYGVINGDTELEQVMEQSSISLQPGDQLYLVSDGLAAMMRYEKLDTLRELTAQQLIDGSSVYDQPPFSPYADDKAVIRIICG